MQTYVVEVSDEQAKAVSIEIIDFQEWLQNVAIVKANQCMDKIIFAQSDKQPNKISEKEREQIVKDAVIKTAAEARAEFEANKEVPQIVLEIK